MSITLDRVKIAVGASELDSLQTTIGKTLPTQYREFLLTNNGGRPTPGHFKITWSDDQASAGDDTSKVDGFLAVYDGDAVNFVDYFETHEGRIPDDTVAIATDPYSNLVLLGTSGPNEGKVYFWSRSDETEEDEPADYSNVGFVASSFNEFLESLFDAEA